MAVLNWDRSHIDWSLDPAFYISAPTSLKDDPPPNGLFLHRAPAAQNLPQGRIIEWFRPGDTGRFDIYFRNQAALGGADAQNTYRASARPNVSEARFYRFDAGVRTTLVTWPWQTTPNAWNKIRISWWNSLDDFGEDALAMLMEYQVGALWVAVGTFYDPLNSWKESAINRVGIGSYYSAAWHDDTEIWRAAS